MSRFAPIEYGDFQSGLREFKGDGGADQSGSSNSYIERFHMAILSYSRGAFVLRDRVSGSLFRFRVRSDFKSEFAERALDYFCDLSFQMLSDALFCRFFRFPFNVSFAMRGPLSLSARGWRSDGGRSADVVVLNLVAIE